MLYNCILYKWMICEQSQSKLCYVIDYLSQQRSVTFMPIMFLFLNLSDSVVLVVLLVFSKPTYVNYFVFRL